MPTGTNLDIKNTYGKLVFTGEGKLKNRSSNINFNSSGLFKLQTGTSTELNSLTGNTTISNENGSIDIDGRSTSTQAVYIQADNGGIGMRSGIGGFEISTVGDAIITTTSSTSNISIGSDTLTQSINIDSLNNINLSTEDISIIASDALNLISQSGNITIGSSTGTPIFRIEDGNLLINQFTSTDDHQLDIKVTDASSQKLGYNGIMVTSSNTEVATDLTMRTSNTSGSLSMGTHPSNSNYSRHTSYLAYQSSNAIVVLNGPSFSNADIGRVVYWSSTNRRDTIQSIGRLVVANSDSTNITVIGTYTSDSTKNYLIQIDSNVGTNTFRWSSDGGNSFEKEFVNITYSTSNIVALDNGLSVEFTSNTGYNLNQQMSFIAAITANVGSSSSITIPETLYTIQPDFSYIGTNTATDLVIKTNDNEKIRITGDGNIGFKQQEPDAEFHVNSNYNRSLLVNESLSGNQLHPSITTLKSGGYVIVWESEDTDGSEYGVYGQRYMTDGTKIGTNFKVNVNTTNNQSNPDVAYHNVDKSNNFIVVWNDDSISSDNYDIYCQIYKNGIALQSYDIAISTTFTAYEQMYPRVAGLTNGNYIVVWCADISDNNQYNVYGQIIDNNGNLVGSRIDIDTSSRAQVFPYVAALSDNDSTASGGFVVTYMTELTTDDDRYSINFQVYTSSGISVNGAVAVTSAGSASNSGLSDGLASVDGLRDGGFIMTFYRNYEADTSLYNDNTNVTGVTSGASGIIDARYNSVNIITLRAISGIFLQGEEITIVDSGDTFTEKIIDVTSLTTTTANLTLSTAHKEVYGYRFNSSATDVSNAIWGKRINTTLMYEDEDRKYIGYSLKNRNNSIYNYRRPLASIATSFDNDNAIFAWTNGNIPNLYYQIVDTSTGTFLGNEVQFGKSSRGFKQRNPTVAPLRSIRGNEYGYVSVWDNTGVEYLESGIYQQLIGYNHNYLKIEDGYSKLVLDYNGKLGLGTDIPLSTLHIKSNEPTNYNNYNSICGLTIQNTAMHRITNEDQQMIQFLDGGSIVLGQIKGSSSLSYDDFNPIADSLVGYYKFDESSGARVVDSSSSSNVNASIETVGILKNFDLEKCWVPGFINNCLLFDGINNYVQIHNDADNNLNTLLSSGDATFSVWVKIPTYIKEGDNVVYDIISNIDDEDITSGISGLFVISLVELLNSGNLNLRTQVRSASATTTVTGSITVNSDSWTHLAVTITQSGTIIQYINGIVDGTDTISGSVTTGAGLEEQTVYIGSRNSSGNFYRGRLDEFRIYNNDLTSSQITRIYNYGNNRRGALIFNAGDDSNTLNKEKSLMLDYDGKLANAKFKQGPFTLLTGILTGYNSNTTIEGSSTLFKKELAIGDIIRFNGSNYPITTISSNTSMTISEIPLTGDDPSTLSEQSVTRKPAIISCSDKDEELSMYTDEYGNMVLGNYSVQSKLTISGSGESNYLPYITLVNTTNEDIDGGRESRITFRGNNGGLYSDLVRIEGSHLGVGDNAKGQLKITTNNGTDLNNVAFNIVSNGSIALGNVDTPPKAELHCRNNNGQFNLLLESYSNEVGVFSEKSAIYFGGVTSINDDTTSLSSNCLVAIEGSGDSSSNNFDGRIDFLTNNDTRGIGAEKRMTINSQGNVGISIYQPQTLFHVGPEIRNINYTINAINNYTGQEIQLDSSLLSDTETQLKLVGGTAVIGNTNLTSHKILSIPNSSNIIVQGDITSSSNGDNIYLNYPGLNVASNGYVGIGTTEPTSMLHVAGTFSLPIKQITNSDSPYAVTVMDYTIICNMDSGSITVNLPQHNSGIFSISGRMYTIKKLGAGNTLTIDGSGTTIDGSLTKELTTNYKYITIQSNGSAWHIISEN
jgi:hypothetical protein